MCMYLPPVFIQLRTLLWGCTMTASDNNMQALKYVVEAPTNLQIEKIGFWCWPKLLCMNECLGINDDSNIHRNRFCNSMMT